MWNQTCAIEKCNISWNIFLDRQHFFFNLATVKTRPVWNNHGQSFQMKGVQSWQGHGVMMKKSCFKIIYSKTWLFRHEFTTFSLCTPIIWKPWPCMFQNRSCFHCSYNQIKNVDVLKILFMKTALLFGLVLAKPLWTRPAL